MSIMKLVQTNKDGRKKTWNINSTSNVTTFGTSRKANISSIDSTLDQFESVIEYRNSKWYYISFSIKNNPAEFIINSGDEIKLNNSTLNFYIFNNELNILENLKNIQSNGQYQYILILVTKNNHILNLSVNKLSPSYKISINGKQEKISLTPTEIWNFKEFSDHELKYKIINGIELAIYKKNIQNQIIDKESKITVTATLAITCVIIAASLFYPNNNNKNISSSISQPTKMVIIKNDINKNINKNKKQQENAPKIEISQNINSQGQSGTKITALLKNSLGIRITKLIGKVSATEARSANIITTTKGIKAGQESSGRALASLGKIESSGRNWNGETINVGSGVSTAGIGGGKNGNQLGSGLAQGKTGSGGVGLLEDESEIVGGLDREVIAEYIKTQLGQILYCYERQLSANPNLYGKIAVKFTISGSGLVETQSINDTTLKNSSVESCILSKISKWKFPQPRGGTKVLVTYPFLFKSVI